MHTLNHPKKDNNIASSSGSKQEEDNFLLGRMKQIERERQDIFGACLGWNGPWKEMNKSITKEQKFTTEREVTLTRVDPIEVDPPDRLAQAPAIAAGDRMVMENVMEQQSLTKPNSGTGLVKDICRDVEASLVILVETHSSGVNAQKIIKKIGFDKHFVQDAIGQAGGIWILWDSKTWKVEIINTKPQWVHLKVSWMNSGPWFLTAVYGSPHLVPRQDLWDDLRNIYAETEGPWAVIGDFNEILDPCERLGGSSNPSFRGMKSFQEMVNHCELLDGGFNGDPFTFFWGTLQKRLDRLLFNLNWRMKFQEAFVTHLPRFSSDHKPVLVNFKSGRRCNKSRRPFRFESMWVTHRDFKTFVQQKWRRTGVRWNDGLKDFQNELKVWNLNTFGNLFSRKRFLIRKLRFLEKKLQRYKDHATVEEHDKTWQEYDNLLAIEEIYWFQKSRSKWLEHGDRNTKYFHGVTTVKRRRSIVETLQDEEGNWITSPKDLESLATGYYKELFSDQEAHLPYCLRGAFPPLEEDDLRGFDCVVTVDEIYNTLKSMGAFKAPGPDGFQAIFFQSQWMTIKDTFCNLVADIFADPGRVEEVNSTFLALIPKMDHVTSMKNFRPISLCNVTYKVVTKILAARLRVVLQKTVGPNQSSFVPARQIGDNIAIAQEVFHSMNKKNGRVGWMAVKIDLEKAYDRINWDFVKDTLEDIGLPDKFVLLVWHCITSCKMRVLWNGEALDEFKPSRGIRQGDPISPYLFVLCIERLFQLINVAVDQKLWKPVKIARAAPSLSYLAFADDLILFAEASQGQASIMKKILELFCNSSGQKVSIDKTRVFFSKNVTAQVKKEVLEVLEFHATDNLGKYLGVPIIHKRISKSTYEFILDKVNQRLSTWKAKILSFAGRVTLAKSVIQAIPSYVMQSASLPISVCESIDKSCRNFIWGDSDTQRKVHLISWEKVCTPKRNGGLGLRSMRMVNAGFMMKAGWRLSHQKSALWAQVMRGKYGCGADVMPEINTDRAGSNLWRGICKHWDQVQLHTGWKLGDGKSIKFWEHKWVDNLGPLKEVSFNTLHEGELNCRIKEFVTVNGEWDLGKLTEVVPNHIINSIRAIPPPSLIVDEDVMIWKASTDGKFSMSSAYNCLCKVDNLSSNEAFKLAWKWQGPERIRCLLWKLSHSSLLTNLQRYNRRMTDSPLCPVCGAYEESLLHIFRDCQVAAAVWRGLHRDVNFFLQTSWCAWLTNNLKRSNRQGVDWDQTFGLTLEQLWRSRNDWVFKNKRPCSKGIIDAVRRISNALKDSLDRRRKLDGSEENISFNQAARWYPPPPNVVTVNCDGAVCMLTRRAGCGGLLRNDIGTFLGGFNYNLGCCSVLKAELWAIFYGLKLAWGRGIRQIRIESDSLVAIKLLRDGCPESHIDVRLVRSIHDIYGLENPPEWIHIQREANGPADVLAKIGIANVNFCNLYAFVPDFLKISLWEDAALFSKKCTSRGNWLQLDQLSNLKKCQTL